MEQNEMEIVMEIDKIAKKNNISLEKIWGILGEYLFILGEY